jgi:hypothetical protein
MPKLNYWAVIVAAVVAFVGSSVWYVVFGNELAKVSPVFAELRAQKPAAWRNPRRVCGKSRALLCGRVRYRS